MFATIGTMRPAILAVTGLLATGLSTAGCGSSSKEPKTTAQAAPKPIMLAGTSVPIGTYRRQLTRAELRREGASLAGPPDHLATGTVLLTVIKDGRIEVNFFRGQFVAADVTPMPKGLIKLRGADDASFCGPGKGATYRWSVRQGALTLAKNGVDRCAEEAAALVGTWRFVG